MRRREKTAGYVWLASINRDGERFYRRAIPAQSRSSAGEYLEMFVSQGFLVEMEQDVDRHIVRVYPLHAVAKLGYPRVAASYNGTGLRSVLASAWQEFSTLYAGQASYNCSPREVVRWVSA